VEEGVYRLLLCAPLVAVLRPGGAVAASGVVFAALHFRYGNPSPDNFIGGYLFAWAYLKSGTIAVPLALHAAANLAATAINLAGWWLLGS
jgi:membrane protease YdiL (CAAX protease family)